MFNLSIILLLCLFCVNLKIMMILCYCIHWYEALYGICASLYWTCFIYIVQSSSMRETLTCIEEYFIQYFYFNASIRKHYVCLENMLSPLRASASYRSTGKRTLKFRHNVSCFCRYTYTIFGTSIFFITVYWITRYL